MVHTDRLQTAVAVMMLHALHAAYILIKVGKACNGNAIQRQLPCNIFPPGVAAPAHQYIPLITLLFATFWTLLT